MAFGDPVCNPVSFRAEAQWQRVCANCGSAGQYLAHHVIYEQHLRRMCGLKGNALYDTRCALRLCKDCHDGHHGIHAISTLKLLDQNIEYAFEVLGRAASGYLARYYEDAEEDGRIIEAERMLEAA